jgi:hypothetical protein
VSDWAYVGITPCNCMVCATVDEPQYARDNAKHVSAWLRDGLRVERVPVEQVRQELGPCKHSGGTSATG